MAAFNNDVQASLAPDVDEAECSITSRNYALDTPQDKNLDPTFPSCLVSSINTLRLNDRKSPTISTEVAETPKIYSYTAPLPISGIPRSVPENFIGSRQIATANILATGPPCPKHDSKMDSMIRSLETNSQTDKSIENGEATNHVISFKVKEASVKLKPGTIDCSSASNKTLPVTQAKVTVKQTQDACLNRFNSATEPLKPQQDTTVSNHGRSLVTIGVKSECLPDIKTPSTDTSQRNDLAVSVLGTGGQFGEDHNELLRKDLEEDIPLLLTTNTDGEAETDGNETGKTTAPSDAGESYSGNSSSPAGNAAELSSSPSNSNQNGLKRRSGGDGSSGGGEEEGDRRPTKNKRLSDQIGDQPTNKRLACTFWLHDPFRYRTTSIGTACVDDQYSLCAFGIGFEGISKLKEHLRRIHPSPTRCGRCKSIFKNQVELDTHHAKAERCELREILEWGMTPKIEEQLKNRKKNGKKLSEEEQAREIYRLIFPGSKDPECFYRNWTVPTPASDQEHRLFWTTLQEGLPQRYRTRLNTNKQIQTAFPNPEDRSTFLHDMMLELNTSIIEVSTHNRGVSDVSESDLPSTSYIESTFGTNSRCGDRDCTGCPICGSFPPNPHDTSRQNNASESVPWDRDAPSTDSGYNSNPVVAGNSNFDMNYTPDMTDEEWKNFTNLNYN